MTQITLLQSRNNNADNEGLGQVYTPTSLWTAGSRLIQAGVEVDFQDGNLRPVELREGLVGATLLGAPYIPEIRKMQADAGSGIRWVLGGRVISGLARSQMTELFGSETVNGNSDDELAEVLGIDKKDLPPQEETSLIPAYERISDEDMKEYLSHEISLYVSQGCIYGCDFCAAEHGKKEQYREMEITEKDMNYLVARAKKLGLASISIYMSNLDVFQTPEQILEFAKAMSRVRKNNGGFELKIRGLAGIFSFLNTRKINREAIEALAECGFDTVGFGVDGVAGTWAKIHKGQNTEDGCVEAIRSTREDFGITPEMFMVFGHEGVDTQETLKEAYEFTMSMAEKYGAIPRPHVAKPFIPGNKGWRSTKYAGAIEQLMRDPRLFQGLDFTALPTALTHPDPVLRQAVTEYYLRICEIKGNTTNWLKAVEPGMSQQEMAEITAFNKGRYDR